MSSIFSSLSYPNFRNYFIGHTFSTLGTVSDTFSPSETAFSGHAGGGTMAAYAEGDSVFRGCGSLRSTFWTRNDDLRSRSIKKPCAGDDSVSCRVAAVMAFALRSGDRSASARCRLETRRRSLWRGLVEYFVPFAVVSGRGAYGAAPP